MADECGPAASAPTTGPSLGDNIDISTTVFVTWGCRETLAEATFDARRVDSTQDAFFKLRSTIVLKTSAPRKTPFFLFIHPERIQSLELDAAEAEETTRQEEARTTLGSDTVRLRFTLTRPADLVGPRVPDLTPKNKASGDVLDSMRSLAQQVGFEIYLPRNVLSQARLASLCKAASSGALKSIARQADLTSLYRGKGGQLFAQPDAPPGYVAPPPSSPPSYDELGPSPPLAPLKKPSDPTSRKRRRRSRSSGEVASAGLDPADVERMCRKIVEEQKADVLRAVEAQQDRLYERLLADLKPYIGRELDGLEARVLGRVEELAGKQAEAQEERLEERIESVRDEVNGILESRVNDVSEEVEEEFYGLRVRLEDFIKEELTEAEERIVEHLENSASVSLHFG